MSRHHFLLTVATAALIAGSVATAAAGPGNPCNPCSMKGTVFHVQDPMGRNTITFRSEAPLEDIIGTTNQVTGKIVFDPKHLEKGGHGELTVSAAAFSTGIPLRDEHLRGADWLNSGKYSDINLKISKVKNVKKVKSSNGSATYDVTIVGELTLRGKSVPVSFPARITYLQESEMTKKKMAGDLLAVRTSFEVALADFGITGPKGAGLVGSKVGETIAIDVSLIATTAASSMAANPCNPCGGKVAANPCNPCGGKTAANPCNPCGGKTAANPCNPCGK
jgi:polyisoprenoid-binding protein YceI